ncbi:MAG: transcriptional regulator [Acidobacteriota bacterium]|nr:transcriptional regulator [Acidobacteriota bacterium]
MRADNSLLDRRVYEFGEFRLDAVQRVLENAGRPLSIAPKALDVLILLVENRGRIVEKEELLGKVWPGVFVEDNNLAFNISVLRKLFGESSSSPHYIETVPKRGYRFTTEVVQVPEKALPGTEVPRGPFDGEPAPFSTTPISPAPVSTISKFARPLTFVSVLLVALVAMLTYYFQRAFRAPKLTDKDTIVLADFLNKTQDAVFDGTLHRGLAVQLEQSPFLSLISEGRIRQTLRLMGQPRMRD